MNLTLFLQLVAAAVRDEFNATIIIEGTKITVLFEDGRRYSLSAAEERPESAEQPGDRS